MADFQCVMSFVVFPLLNCWLWTR